MTRPCSYDHQAGHRVIRGEHRDDCTNLNDCTGCVPCTAPHCVVCGRTHATNANPMTCTDCQAKIREDLTEIRTLNTLLAIEARDAAHDGRLAAAAPIPGGTAQVLIGPTVRLDVLRVSREMSKDHHRGDPIPPLAILAQWEDIWRTHLDHTPASRASLSRCVGYLLDQVPYMAQLTGGPDFVAFARQVRTLRSRLEHVLHDEQEPEFGVECFECGDRLVRRFRRPQPCRHRTPARDELKRWLQLGYPEALTAADVRAARRPCGGCNQGGIDDPRAGLSWECPGCRREYDPGEYATAVRRDLIDSGPTPGAGDGWTHVAIAAEAASMMTGIPFTPARVRRWMDRGQVASMCRWEEGSTSGSRLVLWDDVKERAADAVERAHLAEMERRREAEQEQALRSAVAAGEEAEAAGSRLGIHPARVEKFLDRWAAEARQAARGWTA